MKLLQRLATQVLVFDGAMGSLIQTRELSAADFGGEALEGCNENLVLTRPDVIREIHAQYLAAGADIIETDSFGGTPIVLAEYDLAEKTFALNHAAAALAKSAAQEFSTNDQPRFVAGSVGPGTKLPTLGHIDFVPLKDAFRAQCLGLLDGGVDLLALETCQDILQAKAAIVGAQEAMIEAKISAPILVSVTIEQTGTMLIGTEIGAALTALTPYGIDLIGMNCATGPKEMEDNVRYLSQHATMPMLIMPNAGLPENVGGRAHYNLTPEEFVKWQTYFVEHYGAALVGGCCGTTPEHIRALANAMRGRTPKTRTPEHIPAVSSIYAVCTLDQEPRPLIIGERTNANGSKKFRDLLQEENWDGLVDMGKEQVAEGAHTLDVCVAYVGRNEVRDMEETVRRFATQIPLPLVIDSTETPVLERALQIAGGRCIINSINLEDGRARPELVIRLAKRYGAALIALTIDEDGMAKTAAKKLAIAQRIYEMCVDEFGLRAEDILFDTLTFTLGSGDAEFRDAGLQTLDGIRAVKAALPGVRTVLGVSNISFGLQPAARVVLNSMFLHAAVDAGLDAAIVHASKILPLNRIPDEAQQLATRLIRNDHAHGDPLTAYMGYFDTNTIQTNVENVDDSDQPIEERLQRRIVDGNKKNLSDLLTTAMEKYAPLDIINNILLEGMKTVGELFGAGKMQLPFVLQAAEVMKTSVAFLEPHMERAEGQSKGRIVLATVKGDVHDIGKNLVDIILTNNGYSVKNLGIKVGLEQMLAAADEYKADAIGMSGLLVKSTAIMKENLEEMAHRGLNIPVICGGAALTRRFVENDLSQSYGHTVFYGKDAFEGLRVMEALAAEPRAITKEEGRPVAALPGTRDATATPLTAVSSLVPATEWSGRPSERSERSVLALHNSSSFALPRSSLLPSPHIPTPPFFGTKVVENIPLARLFPLINKTALYKGQWQFRQGKTSKEDFQKLVRDTIEPIYARMTKLVDAEKIFTPKVVYGYFPCQSDGNELIVHEPQTTNHESPEICRFTFPRQPSAPHWCLADFFRTKESGEFDVIGFHVVTIGDRVKTVCDEWYAAGNYTDYLYLHGLAVETAEALAEYWHKVIRVELGIAGKDADSAEGLWRQGYQGSRYSFGYPACPRLEDQEKLFALLQPERIGVTLSETFQMDPEATTSALIVHHPEARYFDTHG